MHFLYQLSISLFSLGVRIASLFNEKAKLWVQGRRNTFEQLEQWRKKSAGKVVWVHCSSLGEFEQARPVIEAIKKHDPATLVLLTFFSPSGYEVRKNFEGADHVCYLPLDTKANAQKFLDIVRPTSAVIIKYEYWANYFLACRKAHIPLFIVSGILRPDQRFFGVFAPFWKTVLDSVTHFFVQNKTTEDLLRARGYNNVTLAGDTRFDRVVQIAAVAREIPEIEKFRGNSFCIVAGSSWPQEEEMLEKFASTHPEVKMIIVPHEIGQAHIKQLRSRFPSALLWSEHEDKDLSEGRTIIIDTIGMLSSIYRYADLVVICGGFGKGIHNILEAAVWGVPVLFGPNHEKFEEARQLIALGGAFVIRDNADMERQVNHFLQDSADREKSGIISARYVRSATGATERVMQALSKY